MIHREISDKRYQIDALDGLRGFAALIVVFSHTSNKGMFFLPLLDLRGIGKSGVFLFFLLSAFLLTMPLLDKGKEILSLSVMSHYWQRRFFRIYPLYTLYLLAAVLTTLLFKSGIGIPFELDWLGFWDHITLQEGRGVTWSIGVEFKFYFILPIIALITVIILPFGFSAALTFLLLLLILTQVIFPQSESVVNDIRLLPYMPIFIMGTILALIQHHINSRNIASKTLEMFLRILGYFGLIGIIVMTPLVFTMIKGHWVSNSYFHKQFILYALLWSFVLLSAINVKGLIQYFFALPSLRFIGALSFSLYLFHPVWAGAVHNWGLNTYVSAWLVLFCSTVSAYISFKLLEGPVSKFKFTRKSLVSFFAYKKNVS